jgi:uncharacterized protein (DUF1697 family)
MTTSIAFLRAINVAGHAVVKMDALRSAFEDAGCRNVTTVIQSGNVLFEGPSGEAWDRLRQEIMARLSALLGEPAIGAFRSMEELKALVDSDPFKTQLLESDVKRYIAFLAEHPRLKPTYPLESAKEGLEVFGGRDLDVFILSRKVGRMYGFPNAFIEKTFGVPATTRNWNTLQKIAGMS